MAEISADYGSFKGVDGLSIFYRKYQADGEKARVVIAHGLGEHSGRYGNVVNRLLPRGISIWAPDHRGHGQSDGPRGYVFSFYQYIDDLHSLIGLARDTLPEGAKIFLLGHSLGGLIALRFAARFPEIIDGLIVSAPALGLPKEPSSVLAFIVRILSTLRPTFSLANGLDASKISHDEEVVRAYLDDPLVHDRVTARWFTEFASAMEVAGRSASEINIPFLMQLAGDDHLTSADASKRFFESLPLTDKTLYIYKDLYHEIYNETQQQRERVLDDLDTWLMKHI
ncbi:MAG: lysophospholipase [Deltaproteobacteria bacterium]|nr:lysophospholipase [Deltaproteobacteria bacterium]